MFPSLPFVFHGNTRTFRNSNFLPPAEEHVHASLGGKERRPSYESKSKKLNILKTYDPILTDRVPRKPTFGKKKKRRKGKKLTLPDVHPLHPRVNLGRLVPRWIVLVGRVVAGARGARGRGGGRGGGGGRGQGGTTLLGPGAAAGGRGGGGRGDRGPRRGPRRRGEARGAHRLAGAGRDKRRGTVPRSGRGQILGRRDACRARGVGVLAAGGGGRGRCRRCLEERRGRVLV